MSKQLIEMEMLFKALADRTRLRILGLLLAGEVCVCDLQDSLKSQQSKVSRHLVYLRRVGLVRRVAKACGCTTGSRPSPTRRSRVVDAVGHALTHTEIVQRDGVRLKKRTGCCPPTPAGVLRAACCEPDLAVATRA